MSNVSTSNFAQITPKVSSAVGSGFSLNGLLLTKNPDFPLGVPLSFNGNAAVGKYAGTSSSEYSFSNVYFTANDTKTRTPSALLIVGYNLAAQAGWLRGGTLSATLADLVTITNGVLVLDFGGASVTLSSIDFSAQTSLSGCATVLQTALRAAGSTGNFTNATVTYNSQAGGFIIKSGANDSTGTVGYASAWTGAGTDISSVLMLTQADGAIISPVQTSAITEEAFLNNLIQQTQGFFSFAKNWELVSASDNQSEDIVFAKWCANQGVRFAFCEHDAQAADKNPSLTSDFASQLTLQDIAGTSANFGTVALCAFVMGTIASVNYDVTNGRITTAFKKQSGLAVTCDNDDDYKALTGKGYNCYVRDGSAGNVFFGYQRGTISGPYQFIDAYANHVWLNDQMQVALRALLGNSNALPYNQFGYNQVLNAILPSINTALNAGVISTGIDLQEDQLSAIAAETGLTIQEVQNTLYQTGWYFQAVSPSSTVRASRGTPNFNFYYCDGGAIQKIELISTAVR